MLHQCTDEACPSIGQRTSSSCGCHQTDEQVLRAEITRLEAEVDRAYSEGIKAMAAKSRQRIQSFYMVSRKVTAAIDEIEARFLADLRKEVGRG